jgi:Undecaprenyl-phosphate glucose phosphotransferase
VRLTVAWSLVFLLAIAVLYFTRSSTDVSRTWLASYYLVGLLVLIAFRHVLLLLVRRWTRQGRFDRRTVIIGSGDDGKALIAQLVARQDSDVHIIGMFDDRGDDRSASACYGIPKLGKVDDLVEFARHTRVDLVIVALPITAEERLLQMLKTVWVLPLDIRLAAHRHKLRFRPRSYSYIADVPVFDVSDRPITGWSTVIKWLVDKIVGVTALICATPIMLLIALAIKLDSKGPIFFKQRRHGFNNEVFDIYKFRSMYVEHSDEIASKVVTRNDPRVTRVGRFIRKTSLDELPQLFNVVFTGNMSLVGPRPHPIHGKVEEKLYDDAVSGYFARHRVKPGITGWAQINGLRGETDNREKMHRRVEHDLYYIENWSIMFDLCIVARTPFALIRGENAY